MLTIIDGYNLLHHAQRCYTDSQQHLGPGQLCMILSRWAQQHRARNLMVVFDGYPPANSGLQARQFDRMEIVFSKSARTADQVIADYVKSSSSPRRLIVISSDRQVQQSASRRRCKFSGSDQFWLRLCKDLSKPSAPREPSEKRTGLTGQDIDYWLKQFGIK